jgi:hypothetical protein
MCEKQDLSNPLRCGEDDVASRLAPASPELPIIWWSFWMQQKSIRVERH